MRLAWLKDFLNSDRRTEARRGLPGIVAYYWDGSCSRAHDILNVSTGGSYMLTDERWYPDTILKITLENTSCRGYDSPPAGPTEPSKICLAARVVRSGQDGVGLQFLFPGDGESVLEGRFPDCSSDRRELKRFLERIGSEHGNGAFAT